MAKTNTAPQQGRQDTTGIISEDTRLLLRDMIRRGVTCVGITGLGRDAKEDIRSKDRMLKARVDRGDETGSLKAVMDAYKAHHGRRLWVCTAADSRPRTLGWAQDVPDASPEDVFGIMYMAIRCDTWDIRDDVRAVLGRTGLTGIISLPDKIILTPISVRQEQMETAGRVMDALDIITGGGVHMVDAADYICITEPDGAYRQGTPMAGISALSGLADMTDPERMWTNPEWQGLLDPDDVRDYCKDWGIEIADDYGGEAYRGYRRYRTKYGLILQEEESMRISLVPAAGSRISTWAELYRTGQAKATDEDRERVRALVDQYRRDEHESEPDWIDPWDYYDHEDDEPDVEYIPTGISTYDRAYIGIPVSGVTIIGGITSNGKSAVVSQIIVNMIQNGHRIAIYSGEYRWKHYQRLIRCVAAGRYYLNKIIQPHQDPADPDARWEYQACGMVKKPITAFLAGTDLDRNPIAGAGMLRQYNSQKLPHDPKRVLEEARKRVIEDRCDVLIIDNLMKLGLTEQGAEGNNRLNRFIAELSAMAKKDNLAIIVVAHPPKIKGLLDANDIQGGAQVGQAVDRVIFVYRNNDNLKTSFEEAHPGRELGEGDGYMVVVKDRYIGPDPDRFIPFRFEPGSGRITGSADERYTYNWEAML